MSELSERLDKAIEDYKREMEKTWKELEKFKKTFEDLRAQGEKNQKDLTDGIAKIENDFRNGGK